MNIHEEALSIAEIYTKNKNSRLMLKANIESLVARAVDEALDEIKKEFWPYPETNLYKQIEGKYLWDKILALKSKKDRK